MPHRPPAPALAHEPLAREQITHSAHRGPVSDARAARREPLEEFGGPPRRVRAARRTEQRREFRGAAVRAVVRRVASIREAAPALGLEVEAGELLVAGLPTDAVAITEFGHRVQPAPVIGDKPLALLHGCCLQPGHEARRGVSTLELGVSPILPVYRVTNQPCLYPLRRTLRCSRLVGCGSAPWLRNCDVRRHLNVGLRKSGGGLGPRDTPTP